MSTSIVGPWAREKLERLRKYLQAYTKIMKDQEWCKGFAYIDAFAGPGVHAVRQRDRPKNVDDLMLDVAAFAVEEESQHSAFLAGSPQVALDLPHPFTWYVFVEQSAERKAALEKLLEPYKQARKYMITQDDCNKFLVNRVVKSPRVDWRTHRALVFLDPFGMQVDWPTIEALASTSAIEIFLNFPVGMAIQRLLLRRAHGFTERQRQRLDRYFGSDEWYDVLYKSERTLFAEADIVKIDRSGKRLLEWYRERLRNSFGYVSSARLIRNSKGGHLYYLIHAGPNRTGSRIASEILSAGERV